MSTQAITRKSLILTVGTTAAPILHSIEEALAEGDQGLYIYLLYGRDLPDQPAPHPVDIAIEAKTALQGRSCPVILREIDDPQDLDRCIHACEELLDQAVTKGTSKTVVNITGGTKAMAGALTLAACQKNPPGLVFEYTGGARGDSNGRVTGTMVRKEFKNTALQQYLKLVRSHIRKCNYAQALALCELLPKSAHASFLKRSVESLLLWDNFEYKAALAKIPGNIGIQLLKEDPLFAPLACAMEQMKGCEAVKRLVEALKKYENRQGDAASFASMFTDEPVLLVADMLENARRRLEEKKYVDVSMRSYRSMEAAVQICLLKKWGINPWQQLKEEQIQDCPGYLQRIRHTALPFDLGLNNGFELVQHLNGDFPDGVIKDFTCVRNMRNRCFIEHGYGDITADDAGQCIPKAENVCSALLNCAGYRGKSLRDAAACVRFTV